jgi:hypothetical protein
MSENERIVAANNMTQKQKEMIMSVAAQDNNTVSENLSVAIMSTSSNITLIGNLGAGDGFHNAEGVSKIIQIADGTDILRSENFKATNGPDLYVYLSTDKTNADIVNLGGLKDNQNHLIPAGTDITKYNMALIWCRAFSVIFCSAQLLTK